MNPAIYNILHNKPPIGLELIRRDEIFKSIQYHLNPCYIVSEVDPNQQLKSLSKEGDTNTVRTLHQSKSVAKSGEVPKITITAQKIRNKKVTTVVGVDLFKIDTQEMSKFLRNKCQASVTATREKVKDKEQDVITI